MMQNITVEVSNPLEKEISEEYEKELIAFIERMKKVDIDKLKNGEFILSADKCSKVHYRVDVEFDIIRSVKQLMNLKRILDFYDELDYGNAVEIVDCLKTGMFEP